MRSILLALLLGTLAGGIAWVRHRSTPTLIVSVPLRATDPAADLAHPDRSTSLDREGMKHEIAAYATPWKAFEAGDETAFVSILRNGGCPEETVRRFAVAAVGRRYQQRVEEPLRRHVEKSSWWRMDVGTAPRAGREAMLRERQALERALFDLIGLNLADIWRAYGWGIDRHDEWLPADKRRQVTELQFRHDAEAAELEARALPGTAGPTLTDALRDEFRNLRRRQREELGVLLGAEAYAVHQVRESSEARYVLTSLPEARDEVEFQLMVQAAQDVGVETADVLLDQMAHHLPRESVGDAAPGLREKVLARFRELSDPVRAKELEAALTADREQLAAEREAEREMSRLTDLQELAKAGGTEVTLEEARQLADAVERLGEKLDRELGPISKMPEGEEGKALKARLKSEFEAVAVSVLGERGRVITEQMLLRDSPAE